MRPNTHSRKSCSWNRLLVVHAFTKVLNTHIAPWQTMDRISVNTWSHSTVLISSIQSGNLAVIFLRIKVMVVSGCMATDMQSVAIFWTLMVVASEETWHSRSISARAAIVPFCKKPPPGKHLHALSRLNAIGSESQQAGQHSPACHLSNERYFSPASNSLLLLSGQLCKVFVAVRNIAAAAMACALAILGPPTL